MGGYVCQSAIFSRMRADINIQLMSLSSLEAPETNNTSSGDKITVLRKGSGLPSCQDLQDSSIEL